MTEVDIELVQTIGVNILIAIISTDKVVNHSKNEMMYIKYLKPIKTIFLLFHQLFPFFKK